MRVRTVVAGVCASVALASCSTDGVTDLEATSATLQGTMQAALAPVSYTFQYAQDPADLGTAAGVETARGSLPAGAPEQPVTAAVTGLAPETTYAYRLCGRQTGMVTDICLGIREFRTPPTGSARILADGPGSVRFEVPAGVTRLRVDLYGAAGGRGVTFRDVPDGLEGYLGVPGGRGAHVGYVLPVAAGAPFLLIAGEAGADAAPLRADGTSTGAGGRGGGQAASATIGSGGEGGSGGGDTLPVQVGPGTGAGGGGGGGASSLVSPDFTPTVFAMAGGGGGAGHGLLDAADGATGGDGGGVGRDGGISVDPDGNPSDADRTGQGGGPTEASGAGGLPGGQPGAQHRGGAGGSDATFDPITLASFEAGDVLGLFGRGGGGGGGGWYPGGGGASGLRVLDLAGTYAGPPEANAGGGGGGSSYAGGLRATYESGVRAGNGIAMVTWVKPVTPVPPPPTTPPASPAATAR